MKRSPLFSRRQFVAASSSVFVADSLYGQESKDAADSNSLLALEGGQKAVRGSPPRLVRWGDPERERLNAMLGQDSLFYWKGPQTTLLIERFGDKGFDRLGKDGLFHAFATNCRMSEPQAAVAAAQLSRLEPIVAKRSRLGNLLTEKIACLPGIEPHQVSSDDRCVYWFYMLRIQPERLRCDRAEFVEALSAEGAPVAAGYIPVPLYGNPVFQQHGFFAGRWPLKEMGLTAMDYSKTSCPEAEAILKTGVRVTIHESMSEEYIVSVAAAIRKVASHYVA
jgi:dTDP-4-amino-4,6-dideoxygalactose transaminase